MSRHYGRFVGEKIAYPTLKGGTLHGVVVDLSATDNNCCYVRFDGQSKPRPCVAEWCRSREVGLHRQP